MAAITPAYQEVGRVTTALPGMLEADRRRLGNNRHACVEKARQRDEVPLQRALMFRYPSRDRLESNDMRTPTQRNASQIAPHLMDCNSESKYRTFWAQYPNQEQYTVG